MAADDTGADTGGTEARTVPYTRFQSVVEQRNELRDQVAALQAEAQGLSEKAATVDTVTQQLAALQSQYDAANAEWTTKFQIMGTGLTDPDGIETVLWLHGKLPEQDRPSAADWLASLQETPDKMPTALRGFFSDDGPQGQSQQQGNQGQGSQTQQQGQGRQGGAGGLSSTLQGRTTGREHQTGQTMGAAEIRAMNARIRQGDPEAIAQARKLTGIKGSSRS